MVEADQSKDRMPLGSRGTASTTARPDAIVVGGGVAGCSIAYRLAERGRQVLLLERRELAAGASGRNAGMTGAGKSLHDTADRAVAALTTANLALIKTLAAELDADFSLRLPGTMDIATTPEQWDHLESAVATQRANGIEAHLLDRQEARAMMPALAEDILGAEFIPGRGHLWPFALVHAFARAAARHGAVIRTGAGVDELVWDGERAIGVRTGGETILADEIVLATNAYTPHLLLDLPDGAIVPARGQILVTEARPPILPHPFGTNFDKEYGRQTPDGKILFGGFRRLDEDQGLGHEAERVTPAVITGLAANLVRLFPALTDVRVVRCWAGIMGFTPDGLPLIGRYAPGLTLAVGFNGGGFSWTSITGKIVADLLDDRAPGFDIAPFDPGRFDDAGTDWSNPFTAGERSDAVGVGSVASHA